MSIQHAIGADIMMQLDDVGGCDEYLLPEVLELTLWYHISSVEFDHWPKGGRSDVAHYSLA